MLTEQELAKLWSETRKQQGIAYEEAKVSLQWIAPPASVPVAAIRFGVLMNLTPRLMPPMPHLGGAQP